MQEIVTNINRGALTVRTSAEYLSVSIPTMRRLIAKGEIKPIRKLRTLLIAVDELNRWLK